MKLHIVTVGSPKLTYAKLGFTEYCSRMQHYHRLRVTHLSDKWAMSADKFISAAGEAYTVALVIDGGQQLSSHELAALLHGKEQQGLEVCLMIGGPDGLPATVVTAADYRLSLSKLTLPHDLAMLVLAEALYRATTITAGQPYHH